MQQPPDFNVDPETHLTPLADGFSGLSLSEIARRLRDVYAPPPSAANPDEPVMLSDADAAQRLGLRSPSTVRDLLEQGLLVGDRRDGAVFVTRASVDQALGSPTLATSRSLEEQLWSLLGDLDLS